jgi:hypothetical protein
MNEAGHVRALFGHARKHLTGAPGWIDYVRKVYEIDPGEHPYLTYVGVNFTKETVKNYKFYFAFFRRLTDREISTLLPVPDRGHFEALYAKWEPNSVYDELHRGTTFALKVDADGSLTHYYHLRIPGLPFGLPERLTIRPSDLGNLHGACEEFSGSKVHLKRYWYCRDVETIAESMQMAGLGALVDQARTVDLLEYIESDGRDKMDWVTTNPHLIEAVIEQHGPTWLRSELKRIAHDCGFDLYGPGSARDLKDHAIYYIQRRGPFAAGGHMFDGVRTFVSRHLKIPGFDS